MAFKKAGRTAKKAGAGPGRFRKVTYSLPAPLARRLEDMDRRKSRVVAEALAFYFAEQDKRALRAIYEEAAADPRFQEDNAAIQEQFAALDNELDESA